MFWPFRRKEGPPGPEADLRPRIGTVARALSLMGPTDAPEETTDPAEVAEFERIRRLDIERNRATRESADWEACGLSGVANIFPRAGATRRDLIELGGALVAWQGRHHPDVVAIHDVECLLAGQYPPMEYYMGCINGITMNAPRWEIRPVQVECRGRLFDVKELMACLSRELPEDSYSVIGTVLPG